MTDEIKTLSTSTLAVKRRMWNLGLETKNHLGDPRWTENSTEHRVAMRIQLYGAGRQHPKGYVNAAVGAHTANYGDEAPPKWESTKAADYTRKIATPGENRKASEDIKRFIKGCHFELKGYGADELGTPVTSNQRDYGAKDRVPLDKPQRHVAYPPIFRDELELEAAKSTVYGTTFVAPSRDGRPAPCDLDNRATHFKLGDDAGPWGSVTKSTHVGLRPGSPVEVERWDGKPSTVMDNPDGEQALRVSIQKTDYVMPEGVDRRDLIVDNSATVKDLKSTHFSLGKTEGYDVHSQYQSSFSGGDIAGCLPPSRTRYIPSSVRFDEDENHVPSSSTHKRDFTSAQPTPEDIEAAARLASDLKHVQSTSSIALGDEPLDRPYRHHSVTKTDFYLHPPHPLPADPMSRRDYNYLDMPKPGKRPVKPVTGPNVYPPVAASTDTPRTTAVSVMAADYPAPPCADGPRTPRVDPDLRRSRNATHFTLGTDGDEQALTRPRRLPVIPPSSQPLHTRAARTKDMGFASTLRNTITRYPDEEGGFVTVTAASFVAHALDASRQATRGKIE
ncbi:hypothetical protein HK101_004389, partial [Irineochytrium annulatum]